MHIITLEIKSDHFIPGARVGLGLGLGFWSGCVGYSSLAPYSYGALWPSYSWNTYGSISCHFSFPGARDRLTQMPLRLPDNDETRRDESLQRLFALGTVLESRSKAYLLINPQSHCNVCKYRRSAFRRSDRLHVPSRTAVIYFSFGLWGWRPDLVSFMS